MPHTAGHALYLVLLQAALLHHLVPLLLEGDDDESHEDVDKEEREDDEVDDIEDGHLHAVAATRASVFLRHVDGVLQDSVGTARGGTDGGRQSGQLL